MAPNYSFITCSFGVINIVVFFFEFGQTSFFLLKATPEIDLFRMERERERESCTYRGLTKHLESITKLRWYLMMASGAMDCYYSRSW